MDTAEFIKRAPEKTAAEWAEHLGVTPNAVYRRAAYHRVGLKPCPVGRPLSPHDIPAEDMDTLRACAAEYKRLLREAKQLAPEAMALKFGHTPSTIRVIYEENP